MTPFSIHFGILELPTLIHCPLGGEELDSIIIWWLLFLIWIACIADHRDSPPPPELPSPAYKSTPRKRITTSTITTRQHRRHDNKGDHAAFNGPEQTDSVEVIAVKEPAKVAKEEASICGPHIQILLAVLVFLVFISVLVYSLTEDTHQEKVPSLEWSHGQHQRFSVFIFRNMW